METKKSNALILVLVVLIIIGLGTTAILQAMISYANMQIVSTERIRAQYLAEAGIQVGIWQLQHGLWPAGAAPIQITTEGWPITVTKSAQPDGSYKITAQVQYPGL